MPDADIGGRYLDISVALAFAARAEPRWFVLSANYGRRLGESIHHSGGAPVPVVDQLDLSGADCLDIGRPYQPDHPVVPVVAKTQIFQ